jgi:hypothetical protein
VRALRHFLQYWKTYNPEQEFGTPLDCAASAQFKKVKPSDTLWIVALRDHSLALLGKLVVGSIVPRKKAIEQLGNEVYDAPLVVLAQPGTEQDIIETDIQELAYKLRFQSAHDRLDPKRPTGQQLQSLRELTEESVQKLQAALESADHQKHFPSRLLFARVGWMTYYAGPQSGDEKPIGGGSNNRRNIGHEVFNFMDFGGRLYGFVRAADRRIKLKRIDPLVKGDTLRDVLVVFVSNQRIVGWYRKATVYGREVEFPTDVSKEIKKRLKQTNTTRFSLKRYRFECSVDDAVLLPRHERNFEIPGAVTGGFGQSNVCYTHRNSGKRKTSSWMNQAVTYVLNYGKGNLLMNPNADNESDETATISQEKSAGFQSNPTIRRAIEKFAMSKANSILVEKGYRNLKDTSNLKPYDYTCERDGNRFFVEVKGTQTKGKTLILTRGEVDHINGHSGCILVIVHSVMVSTNGAVRVSGGIIEVKESWSLCPADLSPIQYTWMVK